MADVRYGADVNLPGERVMQQVHEFDIKSRIAGVSRHNDQLQLWIDDSCVDAVYFGEQVVHTDQPSPTLRHGGCTNGREELLINTWG